MVPCYVSRRRTSPRRSAPPFAQDATKARFKEMVREIGERRDCRDDGDGPVPGESLWVAKPDLNMQQVTAQVINSSNDDP